MALEKEGHGQREHPDSSEPILEVHRIGLAAHDCPAEVRTGFFDDEVEVRGHLGGDLRSARPFVDESALVHAGISFGHDCRR